MQGILAGSFTISADKALLGCALLWRGGGLLPTVVTGNPACKMSCVTDDVHRAEKLLKTWWES